MLPIVRGGDTLVFVVQYDKGWDMFSGDSRMPPVLVMSETGSFTFDEGGEPRIKGLNRAIELVQEKRVSNDTIKDYAWKMVEHNRTVVNGLSARSGEYGEGMWLPLDTVYDGKYSNVDHIISTKWGQDSLWKQYTPYVEGEHALVGCVAVTTAQQIIILEKII